MDRMVPQGILLLPGPVANPVRRLAMFLPPSIETLLSVHPKPIPDWLPTFEVDPANSRVDGDRRTTPHPLVAAVAP